MYILVESETQSVWIQTRVRDRGRLSPIKPLSEKDRLRVKKLDRLPLRQIPVTLFVYFFVSFFTL